MAKYLELFNKVARFNNYEELRKVTECENTDKWTPCDLVIREWLNNCGFNLWKNYNFEAIENHLSVDVYKIDNDNNYYILGSTGVFMKLLNTQDIKKIKEYKKMVSLGGEK